ncbi:pyridoxal phosphate-dependent aminotransferase [Carnobacterium gallinarum]|uniref:pyridoxal phosphate-dependent aminotransferase n=1 Tax=Carnobacterium gallinarum TaxID=2749 RepID=UPI00054FFB98|nr:pyridoxal phosphate-dependent aminotransferase [Carnobacterium gallinarum]
MTSLTDRFNSQTYKIKVSDIRQFDERVSSIKDMLKLTLGEPDFNTPEHVKLAGIQSIENNESHYTGMAGDLGLRKAVSSFMHTKYNVKFAPENEVLVTIGATEALSASLLAILNPGDKIIVPTPIYPGYEPLITLARAEPVYIDTTSNDFVLTPEMIEAAITEHGATVKAIILNYPSNPTGVTYNRKEVEAIANAVKKHNIFVISDEIYSELTYGDTHVSIAEYAREQTILINGLSKSHAMTGWRIGFILAPKELVGQIVKVHQYLVTSATTMAQKAAIAALTTGMNDAQPMKAEYLKRRDFIQGKMEKLGFKIAQPNGAFYIFAKIPAGYLQNSMEFCVDLAEKNRLAIIPGSAFGAAGEGYVRLSYAANMDKLEIAMERLTDYIHGQKSEELESSRTL